MQEFPGNMYPKLTMLEFPTELGFNKLKCRCIRGSRASEKTKCWNFQQFSSKRRNFRGSWGIQGPKKEDLPRNPGIDKLKVQEFPGNMCSSWISRNPCFKILTVREFPGKSCIPKLKLLVFPVGTGHQAARNAGCAWEPGHPSAQNAGILVQ